MSEEDLLKHITTFFPGEHKHSGEGDLITDRHSIINALKGALYDEAIVEVQINTLTRTFFCRVLDHPPELIPKAVNDETVIKEAAYEAGTYLESADHLIITPLEPSIGNFLVCCGSESHLLLRIFRPSGAIELGCFFSDKVHVHGMHVLEVSFPLIARQLHHARPFRAKVPKDMRFSIQVSRKGKPTFNTRAIDISPSGMALVDPMGNKTDIQEEEKIILNLQIPDEQTVSVEAVVRYVTKLRDASGVQYCFGMQFDLETRAVAHSIEKLVGAIQRKYLRELSELAETYGVDYENW